jgi:hypothetical protein
MVALVGAGIATIPWPTMLSVIAQIVAGEAQQPRAVLREFFSKHSPLIVPFMVIVPCHGLISTRSSCPAYQAPWPAMLANTAPSASSRTGKAGPARAIVP